ncbi:hypothetical protein JCM39194_17570 [Desulfotomaculum varum]
MIASLTISLALYLFFIILPGYLCMATTGYPVSEKGSLYKILIRGIVIFFLFTEVVFLIFDKSEFSVKYLNILNKSEIVNGSTFILAVGMMCIIGIILGLIILMFDFTVVFFVKRDLKRLIPVHKLNKKNKLEVAPGDSLKKIFTCYRIVNIRPQVKIRLGDKEDYVFGEVLKFTWNGSEHLLIKEHLSNEIIWVDVENCKTIQFTNITALVDVDEKNKDIIDILHPNLAKEYASD